MELSHIHLAVQCTYIDPNIHTRNIYIFYKFRAMNNSRVYGERIGCTIDNSWKLVDCIRRGRSFAELTNVEFKPEIGTWPWAPVVQVRI